ncbi:MAG: diaminopimelate epimerase [bacterium]
MIVPFVKMSGAGNDVILVDHREHLLRAREAAFARAICDRRFGVGADATILVEESARADFHVRFFNPDGSEYALCGNGARCIPLFAEAIGLPGPEYTFTSDSGTHRGRMLGSDSGSVGMPPAREIRRCVPVEIEGRPLDVDWGDIGVPHAAVWVEDVASIPVETLGARVRAHPAFGPQGTNVSFVQRLGPGTFAIRTFERGVEGETWACGSGSTVIATLARARGWAGDRVELRVRSGAILSVDFADPAEPRLAGPVSWICDGRFPFAPEPESA